VKQGKTEEVCACGDVKSTKALPLADHTPSAKVAGKDIVCTVCGKVLEQGMKPTTGANLTAGEVYANAYYNTKTRKSYSSSFSLSMTTKAALILDVGVTYKGQLQTNSGKTTGNVSIAITGKKKITYNYAYPYMNEYAQLTAEGRKDQHYHFDFASLDAGIVAELPSSAVSKVKFGNSGKTKLTVSLTNAEVWDMYDNMLEYMLMVAEINIDRTIGEVNVSEAELTIVIENGCFKTYTIEVTGKCDAGKLNIAMEIALTD
jgi:hypothetical protein